MRPYQHITTEELTRRIRICVSLNMEEAGAQMIYEVSRREDVQVDLFGECNEVWGWVLAAAHGSSAIYQTAWHRKGYIPITKSERLMLYSGAAAT